MPPCAPPTLSARSTFAAALTGSESHRFRPARRLALVSAVSGGRRFAAALILAREVWPTQKDLAVQLAEVRAETATLARQEASIVRTETAARASEVTRRIEVLERVAAGAGGSSRANSAAIGYVIGAAGVVAAVVALLVR